MAFKPKIYADDSYKPRRRTTKKRDAVAVGSALFGALSGVGLAEQARRLAIYQAWAKTVGPEVAARCEPDVFTRGVLTVRAASSAWQNELTYLKETLREKLNGVLAELPGKITVREIRIISGKMTMVDPPAKPVPPLPAATAYDIQRANSTADAIPDPELRDIFSKTMQKHLRAQKRPKE